MRITDNFIFTTDGQSFITMHSDDANYELITVYDYNGVLLGMELKILNDKVKVK
jgi:hypothetical protein